VNTFALILFGFVLYLAVNGKLTEYAALVSAAPAATPGA
jgi:hypothetical protein